MRFTVRRQSQKAFNEPPCDGAAQNAGGDWVVDIDTPEQLMEFVAKHGTVSVLAIPPRLPRHLLIEDGEPAADLLGRVHYHLEHLPTDEQRLEFFQAIAADYCLQCGARDNHSSGGHVCQCWNDE
jgi:hypothetical protein